MCIFKKSKKETSLAVLSKGVSDYNPFVSEETENDNGSEFKKLSELLNKTEREVKDDCKYYLICKIMSKIGCLVAGYSPTEEELKNKINGLSSFDMGEIAAQPAYFKAIKRLSDKSAKPLKVSAVVDFPFGETSFAAKKTEIKNCVKNGAEDVTVVIPKMVLTGSVKELKKQLKSLKKIKSADIFTAISAEELNESDIKSFLKSVQKFGTGRAAFIFGKTGEGELNEKLGFINKYKNKAKIKIFAGIENVKGAVKVLETGVDGIVTPCAQDICSELVSAAGFKLKEKA